MIVIKRIEDLNNSDISNEVKDHLLVRFIQSYPSGRTPDDGYFVVVDKNDQYQDLMSEVGYDLSYRLAEYVDVYNLFYELAFILSDDGFGVALIVLKDDDQSHWLSWVREHANI